MSDPFANEFAIRLVSDFNERMAKVANIRERDSVWSGILWRVTRNPTLRAFNLTADTWFDTIDSDPPIVVFYTVDSAAMVVTLTDVRLAPGRPET